MREGGCWCYLASGGERERLPGSVTRRGDLLRERDMCSEGESVGAAEWLRARVLLYAAGRVRSFARYLKSPRLSTVVVRRRPVGDAVSRLGRCSTPDPSWRSSGGGLQPHTTLLHYSTLPTPRRPPPPPCAPPSRATVCTAGLPTPARGSVGHSARWATQHTELVCQASPSG